MYLLAVRSIPDPVHGEEEAEEANCREDESGERERSLRINKISKTVSQYKYILDISIYHMLFEEL